MSESVETPGVPEGTTPLANGTTDTFQNPADISAAPAATDAPADDTTAEQQPDSNTLKQRSVVAALRGSEEDGTLADVWQTSLSSDKADKPGGLNAKFAARALSRAKEAQDHVEEQYQENVKLDNQNKLFIVRILQVCIFVDFMGPILSVSLGPNVYVPKPYTAAQKDAGYGVFVQSAVDFPLGSVSGAMQLGPNIPALAQGLGQLCAPWLMRRLGRKGRRSQSR